MSFIFAMVAFVACLPGADWAIEAVVGETVAEGFFAGRKLKHIERLVFLGLPVEPSELERLMGDLRLWEIPPDAVPEKLQWMVGEYVLNDIEMSQLMDAVRHIDISQNLGGEFAKEFARVVKKGRGGEKFRTSFETHGVDIGKLLTYGKRRLEDPIISQMAEAKSAV